MQSPNSVQPHSRDYEAKNLLVLEGLEAVRKRPAMYIGSTDTRGLMHCLWEIIDNSVDEALAGFGREIQVELAADGSIAVVDHARGIPVDTEPRTGLSGVEVVFTKLHAGGKFGNSSYNATGGLHGVGASVVNALSARLDVAVDRNGATWEMSFRRGVVGTFDGDGPDAPFTPGGGLRKGKRVAKAKTGTRVRYWPDRQIFLADAELSLGQLNDRARQTSFLVPGLKLEVADLRMDLLKRTVHRAGQAVDLQPREFRLLEYLMRNAERVVSRTMLLEAVWDYHFDPQTNVIDVHVSRLRQKIDKGHAQPLLHTVRGAGYLLGTRA